MRSLLVMYLGRFPGSCKVPQGGPGDVLVGDRHCAPPLVVYLGRISDSGACRHKDGPWVSGFGFAVPDT